MIFMTRLTPADFADADHMPDSSNGERPNFKEVNSVNLCIILVDLLTLHLSDK